MLAAFFGVLIADFVFAGSLQRKVGKTKRLESLLLLLLLGCYWYLPPRQSRHLTHKVDENIRLCPVCPGNEISKWTQLRAQKQTIFS
jgi:hypothetical protein